MAAPKKSAQRAVNGRPSVLKTERVMLDDISVCEDSGWRDVDAGEIAILREKFRAGEYGIGILTIPSILCWNGQPKIRLMMGVGCSTMGSRQCWR